MKKIILSVIALALTASFTSCDKDDDKDEPENKQAADSTLNIYQAWSRDINNLLVQQECYIFSKDSMTVTEYLRPTEALADAYGHSTDSVYFYENFGTINGDSISSKDSAVVNISRNGYALTYTMKKADSGKYMLVRFNTSTGSRDTISGLTPGEVKVSSKKF